MSALVFLYKVNIDCKMKINIAHEFLVQEYFTINYLECE